MSSVEPKKSRKIPPVPLRDDEHQSRRSEGGSPSAVNFSPSTTTRPFDEVRKAASSFLPEMGTAWRKISDRMPRRERASSSFASRAASQEEQLENFVSELLPRFQVDGPGERKREPPKKRLRGG